MIVAALDGSDHSLVVSESAVAFAGRTPRSELHFVTVIEATSDGPFPLGAPRPGLPSALSVVEGAERYVEAHARQAAERLGKVTDGHVLEGSPRREIVQLGVELGASLLVVGTHDPRGVRRLLLGSVAMAFVREAPFPVLVARAAPAGPGPEFRPACDACRASQRRSHGAELWCPAHADERLGARAFLPAAAPPSGRT
ncbi:MAG TPA: universal stress protein [Polyangiaceae bacterium]|nr:universal stress protein [Polyangiaceae bacterium]